MQRHPPAPDFAQDEPHIRLNLNGGLNYTKTLAQNGRKVWSQSEPEMWVRNVWQNNDYREHRTERRCHEELAGEGGLPQIDDGVARLRGELNDGRPLAAERPEREEEEACEDVNEAVDGGGLGGDEEREKPEERDEGGGLLVKIAEGPAREDRSSGSAYHGGSVESAADRSAASQPLWE